MKPGFVLHKEDQTHFILKHPSGDHLKIAKKGLSPELTQTIKGFVGDGPAKGYDEGGQVSQDSDTGTDDSQPAQTQHHGPVTINVNAQPQTAQPAGQPQSQGQPDDRAPASWLGDLFKTRTDAQVPGNQPIPQTATAAKGQPAMSANPSYANVPISPQSKTSQAPVPQMPNFYGQMQGAVSQEQKGLQAGAEAQGQLGQAEAPISHQEAMQQQALLQEHQQHLQSIYQDMQNSVNDVKNGNIDPDHWWSSKSTGSKILTVIGTILGGASGVRRLQAEISNDAQQQMQNKTTTARAYLEQYKNEIDATRALSLNQTAITNALIQEQAQRSVSPIAKANAQAESGKLMAGAIPEMQQLAMSRLMQNQLRGSNNSPETMIRLSGMMGASNQEKDKMFSEMDSMSKLKALRDNYFDTFDRLHNMSFAGKLSPNARAALVDPLMEALTKDTSGRVTPTNVELLKQSLPSALDSSATRALKRQKAGEFFKRQANSSLLNAYGIPNPMNSVNTAVPR